MLKALTEGISVINVKLFEIDVSRVEFLIVNLWGYLSSLKSVYCTGQTENSHAVTIQ